MKYFLVTVGSLILLACGSVDRKLSNKLSKNLGLERWETKWKTKSISFTPDKEITQTNEAINFDEISGNLKFYTPAKAVRSTVGHRTNENGTKYSGKLEVEGILAPLGSNGELSVISGIAKKDAWTNVESNYTYTHGRQSSDENINNAPAAEKLTLFLLNQNFFSKKEVKAGDQWIVPTTRISARPFPHYHIDAIRAVSIGENSYPLNCEYVGDIEFKGKICAVIRFSQDKTIDNSQDQQRHLIQGEIICSKESGAILRGVWEETNQGNISNTEQSETRKLTEFFESVYVPSKTRKFHTAEQRQFTSFILAQAVAQNSSMDSDGELERLIKVLEQNALKRLRVSYEELSQRHVGSLEEFTLVGEDFYFLSDLERQHLTSMVKKPINQATKDDFEKVEMLSLPVPSQMIPIFRNVRAIRANAASGRSSLDFKYIAGNTNIKSITLWNTYLINRELIGELKGLEELWLNKCSVEGQDILQISKLVGLKKVSLRDNLDLKISDIMALQKALPNCKIDHNVSPAP